MKHIALVVVALILAIGCKPKPADPYRPSYPAVSDGPSHRPAPRVWSTAGETLAWYGSYPEVCGAISKLDRFRWEAAILGDPAALEFKTKQLAKDWVEIRCYRETAYPIQPEPPE